MILISEYTGWSDASLGNDCYYTAYSVFKDRVLIKRKIKRVICPETKRIQSIEYLALYFLLQYLVGSLNKQELQNATLFTDSQYVLDHLNYRHFKKTTPKKDNLLRKKIYDLFKRNGMSLEHIQLTTSKKNKAHVKHDEKLKFYSKQPTNKNYHFY